MASSVEGRGGTASVEGMNSFLAGRGFMPGRVQSQQEYGAVVSAMATLRGPVRRS